MALTIQQIQNNITSKNDQREIINQIADYLEANLGGSSYLVLQSPDTTLWLIGVNDSGALQTTQIAQGTPGTLHLFSPDNNEWNVTVTNEGALLTTEI